MANPNRALIAADLTGVPKTMLWALHNRAAEAARPDSEFTDPASVQIHRSIDYDFDGQFGIPAGSLAARAAAIDEVLKRWIAAHPDGIVVSLGEGLETQRQRVDNGRVRWLSVDLPEAISIREHFLPPTDRFRHIAASALDAAWMDAVDPAKGVFIVAQGLLMYLQPEMVRALFAAIAHRFPAAELVFDVVPRWFSHLTRLGLNQTPHYLLPPMPWGINRDEIEPTLREWLPNLDSITFLDYRLPRGMPGLVAHLIQQVPFVRHEVPSLVHVVPAPGLTTSNIILFRNQQMTSLNGVIEVATRNASSSNDLAVAAGQIIAKRVALGMAAAFDPLSADHTEFGRMVPEKMEAFSAAGMIMMQQATQAGQQITRFASDAIMTATRATVAIATSTTPAAAAETQGRFVKTWFETAATNFMAMGMMALGVQEAVLAPIQETIAANTKRLG